MDAAYDSIEIWAHCILLGHKPIIDVNPRRSVEMQEALRREKKARRTLGLVFPEERRYVERSGWNVPLWARFNMLQKLSIPLVCAMPRTYSPTECRTVS